MLRRVALASLWSACSRRAAPQGAATHDVRTPARDAAPLPFAAGATGAISVQAWLRRGRLDAPVAAATDGWLAALGRDGTMRWLATDPGAPTAAAASRASVREVSTPCRYEPMRHGLAWTPSSRLALDGIGHACCIHDGDDTRAAGAYCADLRSSSPHFVRARVPGIVAGAGSGAGAIALYGSDTVCTRDGGASVAATHRGDPSQPVSAAACNARGFVVVGAGTRALGARREQTVRAAAIGGAVTRVAGLPRGEPLDARVLDDGTRVVLLATRQGCTLAWIDPHERSQLRALPFCEHGQIGLWGPRVLVAAEGGLWFDAPDGPRTRRAGGEIALAAATRIGDAIAVVTTAGEFARIAAD